MNTIQWRSPSNIALVKYWGKMGRQEPRNASVSFTLSAAASDTRLTYTAQGSGQVAFLFEGRENAAFAERVRTYMASVSDEMPFLREYDFSISSSNSFPHSAGIASSASGLSALAVCLVDMGQQIGFSNFSEEEFRRRASHFSRLASGSACRSVYGGAAIWGKTQHAAAASNLYAVPFGGELHEVFRDYCNDILFVSKAEKSVSSSAGHELMEGNPFAAARYAQADDNLGRLLDALRVGEVDEAGVIIEEEALTLHALMMSSRPSFVLMQPESLRLIQLVRQWRKDTGLPLYFTLDAGPNLHLLYPKSIQPQVRALLESDLLVHCEGRQFLADCVGRGAEKLQ